MKSFNNYITEEQLDEAAEDQKSPAARSSLGKARKLVDQLAGQMRNIRIPTTDSGIYDPGVVGGGPRAFKKDTAKVKKDLTKIISQLEAMIKIVNKLT